MYLSYEIMMNINRYSYDVQSFIVKKLVNIDTKMLNVNPKLGCAWSNMAKFNNK